MTRRPASWWIGLRRATSLILPAAVVAAGIPAHAVAQGAVDGQATFRMKCLGCHTIGGGVLVGPDLKGVTALRDHAWLVRWLADPPKVASSGDAIAAQLLRDYKNVQMPSLGLSRTEIDALLAYLAEPGTGTGAAPAISALPAGDAARGKEYFVGQARFANSGAACMACHSIAGIGALGGGQLGPDLTGAYNKWGQAGLVSFVTQPATVTMSAVWRQTPLTQQEGADLLAFLQQASVSERPANTVVQLLLLALGAAVVMLIITEMVWHRRLNGVRGPMVAAASHRTRSQPHPAREV